MGDSVRRDVLVEPEEVVWVVLALECLQAIVLGRAVGLADPILPFLHEEVDVDMLVVRLQRGPQSAGPLALLFKSLTRRCYPDHVHCMARVAASECGLVLTHPSHSAA